MANRETLDLMLDSALAAAVDELLGKAGVWGQNLGTRRTLWQSESDVMTPERAAITLTEEMKERYHDEALMTKWAVTWEFVWGKKPPEEVTNLRNKLLDKMARRETLTPLEIVWQTIITIDTDSF